MPKPIEIEDLAQIRYLGDPRISPNGKRIAYVQTEIDRKENGYKTAIWLVNTDGSERRRFTSGEKKDSSPRWSPDGRRIAFISDRDGKSQLYVMAADGGEAQRLTDLKSGAADPVWSPDGSKIAFTSKVGPEGMVLLAEETDEDRKREEAKSDVKIITTLRYKLDGEGFLDERKRHIFVVSASGSRPEQVTSGDWNDVQPAWSADGGLIAFVSNRGEDHEYANDTDVWVQPLDGGEARRISPGDGRYGDPGFSPDGAWISYTGNAIEAPYGPTKLSGLWIAPAADGGARNLTASLDREVGGGVSTDTHISVAGQRLIWSADSTAIYGLMADRGAEHVVCIGLDGEMTTLLGGEREIPNFSLANDGTLAFLSSTPDKPLEVYAADPSGGNERQLSQANTDWLAGVTSVPAEHFTYEGEGGQEIDAWLMKPPGFNPEVKYPLVLQIHGGPQGMYGYSFFHEMQVLANRGYVVLFSNPRGSTGQGQEFVSAALKDWGGIDYRDLMTAVDRVIEMGFVDPTRMAVMGGSYGGYMTNWIVGQTDRFRAAITMRSTCNRVNHYGTGDVIWSYGHWQFGSTPYDDPTLFVERSPLTYVKNVKTPMLIIASEQDYRCPIEQSEQWFTALKIQRKEAMFIRFPNESHGLSRGGRPDHRIERLQHMVDWLGSHL